MDRTRTTTVDGRLLWPDVAKGICMVLVVLVHTTYEHFLPLGWPAPVESAWRLWDLVLAPLRMPLFFAISGMFAARAAARPWSASLERRIVHPAYLYLLWLLLTFLIVPRSYSGNPTDLGELLRNLVLPLDTVLWYLYALAAFFVVGKLLRRVDPRLVLVLAACLSAVTAVGWLRLPELIGSMALNLVYYLAGMYAPALLRRTAVASLPWFAGTATVFVLATSANVLLPRVLDLGIPVPGLAVLAGFSALAFGVALSVQLARHGGVARTASHIGRNTLAIYVLHMPLIFALGWVVSTLLGGLPEALRANLAVGVLYPVVVTVLVVAGCLLTRIALDRLGAVWLFAPPAWVRRLAPPRGIAGPGAAPGEVDPVGTTAIAADPDRQRPEPGHGVA